MNNMTSPFDLGSLLKNKFLSLISGPMGLRGLMQPGNIDLSRQPIVRNSDGSTSTVKSMSFNDGSGEILIPMVSHLGDRVLNQDEAVDQYYRSGKHLGIFDTPDNATRVADDIHNLYESGKIVLKSRIRK
jgi:hypothetical protein